MLKHILVKCEGTVNHFGLKCKRQNKRETSALGASYRYTIVIGVPHHFILNFLPAFKRFVNQDLRCVSKGLGNQRDHFLSIIGKT